MILLGMCLQRMGLTILPEDLYRYTCEEQSSSVLASKTMSTAECKTMSTAECKTMSTAERKTTASAECKTTQALSSTKLKSQRSWESTSTSTDSDSSVI